MYTMISHMFLGLVTALARLLLRNCFEQPYGVLSQKCTYTKCLSALLLEPLNSKLGMVTLDRARTY